MKKLSKLCLGLCFIMMICSFSFGALISVSKTGTLTTIMGGYTAAAAGDTIFVADNSTYAELITFTKANLTLRSADISNPPTILTSGLAPAGVTSYVFIGNALNNVLDGFKLVHLGAYTNGNNYINSGGSNNATVRNCTIIGYGQVTGTTDGKGIHNVKTLSDVEISGFDMNILLDTTSAAIGGTYTNVYSHDSNLLGTVSGGHGGWGLNIGNAGATSTLLLNQCKFENNWRHVRPLLTETMTFTKCIFLNSSDHGVVSEGGNLTFINCLFMGTQAGAHFLASGANAKTNNFNYCILTGVGTGQSCINLSDSATETITVNHCDLLGSSGNWAFVNLNPNAAITMINTIVTGGGNGIDNSGGGTFTSSYSDISTAGNNVGTGITLGTYNLSTNPQYINTTNRTLPNFFNHNATLNGSDGFQMGTDLLPNVNPTPSATPIPVELLKFEAE